MFHGININLAQQVTTRLYDTDNTIQHRQTQNKKKINKRSTNLERSVRQLLEGLNQLLGTNLILNSDVDQDT